MKRLLILAILSLAAVPAMAQDAKMKVVIGGVDQRVPPLQIEHLARQLAEKGDQLARAVALLSIEKADRQDTDKALADAKAELDYWHRWCGDKPGCAQAAVAP